jgi:hypothetical protein
VINATRSIDCPAVPSSTQQYPAVPRNTQHVQQQHVQPPPPPPTYHLVATQTVGGCFGTFGRHGRSRALADLHALTRGQPERGCRTKTFHHGRRGQQRGGCTGGGGSTGGRCTGGRCSGGGCSGAVVVPVTPVVPVVPVLVPFAWFGRQAQFQFQSIVGQQTR